MAILGAFQEHEAHTYPHDRYRSICFDIDYYIGNFIS